eukprot:NODE_29_length_37665_cov_1.081563.p1 type:complete len:1318 gc:universal NODE_29_length_37665_cov_1.081563:3086-7039(+)
MSFVHLHFDQFLDYHQNLINSKIINPQNDAPAMEHYISVIQMEGLNVPLKDVVKVKFNNQDYISKSDADTSMNNYFRQSIYYLNSLKDSAEIPENVLATLLDVYIKLFDHLYYFMITIDQHAIQWDKSMIYRYMEFTLDQMDRIAMILIHNPFSPSKEMLEQWITKLIDYPSVSYPMLMILFNWIIECESISMFKQCVNQIVDTPENHLIKNMLLLPLTIEPPSRFELFTSFRDYLKHTINHNDPLVRVKQLIHYQQDYVTSKKFNDEYFIVLDTFVLILFDNYSKQIRTLHDKDLIALLEVLCIIYRNRVSFTTFFTGKGLLILQVLQDLKISHLKSPGLFYLKLFANISQHPDNIDYVYNFIKHSRGILNIDGMIKSVDQFTTISCSDLDYAILQPMISIIGNVHSYVNDDTLIINLIKLSCTSAPQDFKNTIYTSLGNLLTPFNYKDIVFYIVNTKTYTALLDLQNPLPLLQLIEKCFEFPFHMNNLNDYPLIVDYTIQLYLKVYTLNNPLKVLHSIFKIFARCLLSYQNISHNELLQHHPGHLICNQFLTFHKNSKQMRQILLDTFQDIRKQTQYTCVDAFIPDCLYEMLRFTHSLLGSQEHFTLYKGSISATSIEYITDYLNHHNFVDYLLEWIHFHDHENISTLSIFNLCWFKTSKISVDVLERFQEDLLLYPDHKVEYNEYAHFFDYTNKTPIFIYNPHFLQNVNITSQELLVSFFLFCFRNEYKIVNQLLGLNSNADVFVDFIHAMLQVHPHDYDSLEMDQKNESLFALIYYGLKTNHAYYYTSGFYDLHIHVLKSDDSDYYALLMKSWSIQSSMFYLNQNSILALSDISLKILIFVINTNPQIYIMNLLKHIHNTTNVTEPNLTIQDIVQLDIPSELMSQYFVNHTYYRHLHKLKSIYHNASQFVMSSIANYLYYLSDYMQHNSAQDYSKWYNQVIGIIHHILQMNQYPEYSSALLLSCNHFVYIYSQSHSHKLQIKEYYSYLSIHKMMDPQSTALLSSAMIYNHILTTQTSVVPITIKGRGEFTNYHAIQHDSTDGCIQDLLDLVYSQQNETSSAYLHLLQLLLLQKPCVVNMTKLLNLFNHGMNPALIAHILTLVDSNQIKHHLKQIKIEMHENILIKDDTLTFKALYKLTPFIKCASILLNKCIKSNQSELLLDIHHILQECSPIYFYRQVEYTNDIELYIKLMFTLNYFCKAYYTQEFANHSKLFIHESVCDLTLIQILVNCSIQKLRQFKQEWSEIYKNAVLSTFYMFKSALVLMVQRMCYSKYVLDTEALTSIVDLFLYLYRIYHDKLQSIKHEDISLVIVN